MSAFLNRRNNGRVNMTYKHSLIQFKAIIIIIAGILIFAGSVGMTFASGKSETEPATAMAAKPQVPASMEGAEEAVFAGGCFWGVEGVFEKINGVLDVVSGYSGGKADTATYSQVSTGKTGHAESVRIMYDPKKVSYYTLLKVFFNVAHDPTELNFQGPDRGTQYRSAVFYTNDEQRQDTETYIRNLESKKVFKKKIVTQIVPLEKFYPAEDYHQDFIRLHPKHPYITYWDMPKIMKLEEMYPQLLKEK